MAKKKEAPAKKDKKKKEVRDISLVELIEEIKANLDALAVELEDCMEKKVAGKRARKLTGELGKAFKLFRKLSVEHQNA